MLSQQSDNPPFMRDPPSLRRELLTALALVFAGALLVGAAGIIVLLPLLDSPVRATVYLVALLAVDVTIFALFGRYLLRRRVLAPLDRLVDDVEAIAAGDYARRLEVGEAAEIARLAQAFNRMAQVLIAHQERLAENVRSLQETNRQLTEARDELLRAEKMASVGRLGAGIAHEVGNPLGAIMGYLGVLRRTVADTRQHEFIAAAEQEAQRIDRIVGGLLDYARPKETRSVTIDVNDVLQQTVDLLERQGQFGRVRLTVELEPVLPPVQADPHQLQQVLVNLLLNARDALRSTEGAAVWIHTARSRSRVASLLPARRRDDPPDVDYSHRRRFHQLPRLPRENPVPPGWETVLITVRDNGPGIPAPLLEQIFEPFVTTKEPGQGTGLGLAVAARLIDSMGGTIRAESRNGDGATFTIVLPGNGGAATG
jgi:two-component system NtrC family sensor kinase